MFTNVMSSIPASGYQPCEAKTLSFDIKHVFQPKLFIPAMLIGTIDIY